MLGQHLFKVVQLAGGAANLKGGTGRAAHGDASRVVAAVFQPPQTFDDDRNYLLGTNIADDSAQARILSDRASGGDAKERRLEWRARTGAFPEAAIPLCGT
jgi:hypothetical protein